MSGMSSYVEFDPTEAASSNNVGAYVRAGSDGALIASQTIAAEEWLNVAAATHAGDGTSITATGTALDVNIASGTIDVDDSLANTAIENTATPVSLIAVNIVTTALANRKWLWLANNGNKDLFWGKTGVTIVNGFPLFKGERAIARIGAAVAVQAIGAAGASAEDLRIMEAS